MSTTVRSERWLEHRFEASERLKVMYSYYVTGKGAFPIDMLRHDGSWPATSEDAVRMEWSFTDNGRRCDHSIRLHGYRCPTILRWSGFNWSVSVDKPGVLFYQSLS